MLPSSLSRARKASESAGIGIPNGLVWTLKLTQSPSSRVQDRLSELAVECRSAWIRLVTSVSFSASYRVSPWSIFSSR